MRWTYAAAAAMLVLGGLAGCGGGGGGGGGGMALMPVAPSPQVAALNVTVSVNDGVAQPDGNGQYAVKAGDVVSIVPSQGVSWSSQAAPEGSVSLSKVGINSHKWSAQLANNSTDAAVYTVVAKLGASDAQAKTVRFAVSGGDARNGEYKVFATNGTQQSLRLNFDTRSYDMTDDARKKVSGSFSADESEPGSYLFMSERDTAPANNSRFRMVDNTVVGGFPFALPKQAGVYAIQPFVASRALVTTQSEIDGIYTRLGINMQAGSRDSTISQFQVSGGGTLLHMCQEAAITSIASCPASSLLTFNVAPDASPEAWRMTNVNNPKVTGRFYIARVAGKNVLLSAGTLLYAPNDAVFGIGLEESASWPVTTASGADTAGSWGRVDFSATHYETLRVHGDATVSGFSSSLSRPSPTVSNLTLFRGPRSEAYFGAQDGTISAVVGARSGPVAGYLQIALKR